MIKEMGRNWFKYLWIGAVLLFGSVPPGVADVVEFTDKDEWVATANDFVTIGFTGFNDNTFITDQFAELGLLFSDGDDNIPGPRHHLPIG